MSISFFAFYFSFIQLDELNLSILVQIFQVKA